MCIRFDIVHVVEIINQFLSNTNEEYLTIVKWILMHLRCTSIMCLCVGNSKLILGEFTDANMIGKISRTLLQVTLDCRNVLWQFILQKCVNLSTQRLSIR